MIEFNYQKYNVRDEIYSNECRRIISQLESVYERDSLFAYKNCAETSQKMEIILKKNDEDYRKYYLENLKRYEVLKDRISWDFVKPLSAFEDAVKPIINEIDAFLKQKSYSENKKASEKLDEAEQLLEKYIGETKFVDTRLRKQINTRIGKIKSLLSEGSLFSFKTADKLLKEIEIFIDINRKKYEESYYKLSRNIDILKRAFEKSAEYFETNDRMYIQEQFCEIEEIMKSQSYERFEDARDILDVIDIKIADVSVDKEKLICKGIEKKLEDLRKKVWIEDWEIIKKGVSRLIEQSKETGVLYNLNLDSFKTDQKEAEKKRMIHDFIMLVKAKKYSNSADLIQKAETILRTEASREEFQKLSDLKRSVSSAKKTKDYRVSGNRAIFLRLFKYAVMFVLILLIVVIFIFNMAKSKENDFRRGEIHLSYIESMVYSSLRNNVQPDKDKIRNRVQAPAEDLEIMSLDKDEVVIRYKGQIYKKKVRPLPKK